MDTPPLEAVVLLGPPGVGKSLLLQLLSQHGPEASILNIGEELRKEGLVKVQQEHPSEAGRQALSARARALLEDACRQLVESAAAGGARVLVLEGAKDLDGALSLLEVLQRHGIRLAQALLLHPTARKPLLTAAGHRPGAAAQRDRQRIVEYRTANWQANAARLIELFSSLGVLAEVVGAAWPQLPANAASDFFRRQDRSRQRSCRGTASMPDNHPNGSLAAVGYAPILSAAGTSDSTPAAAGSQLWMQRAAWCGADGRLTVLQALLAHWIEPVVSARLVTSLAERQSVLAHAAAATGLHSLQDGQPLVVPSHSAASKADARWLGWPGRYYVSRKADGMRCLLIAAEDGSSYLLNRAGSLYRFPLLAEAAAPGNPASTASSSGSMAATNPSDQLLAASLPAGTCLDGELMWLGPPGAQPAARSGFFLAFDVLSAGHQQAWQQRLPERLQLLEQLVPAEAEESSALQAAVAVSSSSSAAAAHARTGTSSAPANSAATSAVASLEFQLGKKQQAPPAGSDAVLLLRKRHLPVSAAALSQLGSSSAACPYPTDGLVFTPAAFPYALGMAQLLYKWQPADQAAADMTGSELDQASSGWMRSAQEPTSRRNLSQADLDDRLAKVATARIIKRLPSALVYECHPQLPFRQAASSSSRQQLCEVRWVPGSIRWDKQCGNPPGDVNRLGQRAAKGEQLSYYDLVAAVAEVQDLAALHQAAAAAEEGQQHALPPHPALQQPFGELYAAVMAEVEAGRVERWLDPAGSGLEVFCYRQELGPPSTDTAAMCRGLVLHPAGGTVAAVPFVRFGEAPSAGAARESEQEPVAAGGPRLREHNNGRPAGREGGGGLSFHFGIPPGSMLSSLDSLFGFNQAEPGSDTSEDEAVAEPAADAANRALYYPPRPPAGTAAAASDSAAEAGAASVGGCTSCSDRDRAAASAVPAPLALSTASFKVDGSLIIAFLWEGKLHTATRRRMDSEQALWAHDWLQLNDVAAVLQPGWTYLFEAAYRDNAHVVPYPFEGLVLLSAVGPDGRELASPAERRQLAARLGVVAAPSLEGPEPELLARLGQGVAQVPAGREEEERLSLLGRRVSRRLSPAATSFEGWVLQFASGQRQKLVQASFKRAGAAIRQLHPLLVWDAVKCGGASRAELAAGLPQHAQRELYAILDALQYQYCRTLRLLTLAQSQPDLLRGAAGAAASSTKAAAEAGAAEQLQEQLIAMLEEQQAGSGLESLLQGLSLHDRPAPVPQPPAGAGGDDASTDLEVCSSPAFLAALQYALQRGSAEAGPMFMPPRHMRAPAPLLRGLVLDCICPDPDGSLPGYTPSPAFAQTHCKSWQRQGPPGARGAFLAALAAGLPPPDTSGITDVAQYVLPVLDGRTLASAASLVCSEWRRLIAEDTACQAAIAAAKAEQEEGAGARRRERLQYQQWRSVASYNSDDSYSSLGFGCGDYGGYGSF